MPAYFTRGSGHNETRPVQRAAGRLRAQPRSAGAQVRDRAAVRAAAGSWTIRRRARSASSATAPATGRSTRAGRSSSARRASRPATCACARIRSPTSCRAVHRRATSASTSSSRTATRRCSALLRLELTPERIAKLRSVLHYNGLPIDARSITDEILVQEGRKTRESTAQAGDRGRRLGHAAHGQRLRQRRNRPRRPTASASTCSRTAAARRRCAPAAATTPSPSASSTRSSRWASIRGTVIKLSGIGCSSKSPAYFLGAAHGFNSVHGRMPSVGTGAMLANRKLIAIGVSGDGDTGAIGIGQFVHLMRRNVPIIYIIEDNGCYGLTKGQFSPTADLGSTLKNGVVNDLPPIDTCALAIQLGASFVARSFSGDKKQLLSILKASLSHRGTCDDRRHLAVRDLQRPRGLDQELRLREGSRRAARRGQLRAVLRGHLGRVRPGHDQGGAAARRLEAVPEEGRRGLRSDRQAARRCGCCTRRRAAASSRPASSTSSRTRTTSSRCSTWSTSRSRRCRSSGSARAARCSTRSWKSLK